MQPFIGPDYGVLSFTTKGEVNLHFECTNPTDKIVFHAKDLKIDEKELNLQSINDTDPDLKTLYSFTYDEEREFVTVPFNRNCKKNMKYELEIQFTGIISDKLYGFYRSSYVDRNGVTH